MSFICGGYAHATPKAGASSALCVDTLRGNLATALLQNRDLRDVVDKLNTAMVETLAELDDVLRLVGWQQKKLAEIERIALEAVNNAGKS